MWESWFDPWVGKIPWRWEWLPTPVFWPGEFHGLYRAWRRKRVGHDWATLTKVVARGERAWESLVSNLYMKQYLIQFFVDSIFSPSFYHGFLESFYLTSFLPRRQFCLWVDRTWLLLNKINNMPFIYWLIWLYQTSCGDFSSPTRDWTHAPLQWKGRVLTTGPSGKSPRTWLPKLSMV